MTRYKVPLGTPPDELASGQPLAPGEIVTLTTDDERDPHNAALITSGRLIKRPDPKKKGDD